MRRARRKQASNTPRPNRGSQLLRAFRRLKRIVHLEEREPVEIRVPGADSPDSVLAHQDRRVRVVKKVSRKVGKLFDHLSGNLGVS